MKVIKGNIIFTPSKDEFKIIENGYIVLNKNTFRMASICICVLKLTITFSNNSLNSLWGH